MTFAEYVVLLQRQWRIWASILALGMVAAVTYSALAPRTYTATATSFVTVAESSPTGGSVEIFQGSQFTVQRVKSYALLVSSPEVLDPVISALKLDMTRKELLEEIEITSPPETVLLQIAVTDADATRAASIADAVSTQLAGSIEELETPRGKAVSRVQVTLTKPAEIPLIPTSPRPLLNLAFGALGGAAAGLLVALLRHQLDRRIKSADDIRGITGMSPLGSTLASRAAGQEPLVAVDYRSLAAERYRTIRTGLKFATIDKDLHHFVVSSPMPNEGKTSVAANLAISWAQTGARVCLVDAGLRRPMVGRLLGVDVGAGLTEVVVGEAELDEALVSWNNGMLTVLPAGDLPPDPAALLGSETMQNLINELKSRFDVVIYDSPPMASVADAVVLARALDGLVLVVRAGSTTRDQLAACVETLRESRLTLLGTVHFGVKSRHRFGDSRNDPDGNRGRTELPDPWSEAGDGSAPDGRKSPGSTRKTRAQKAGKSPSPSGASPRRRMPSRVRRTQGGPATNLN